MRVNEEAEKEEDDGLDICLNNPGIDVQMPCILFSLQCIPGVRVHRVGTGNHWAKTEESN